MGAPVVGPFSNFLYVEYNRSNKSSPSSSVLLLSTSFRNDAVRFLSVHHKRRKPLSSFRPTSNRPFRLVLAAPIAKFATSRQWLGGSISSDHLRWPAPQARCHKRVYARGGRPDLSCSFLSCFTWSNGCRVELAYTDRGRQARDVNQFTTQDDTTKIHAVDTPSQCGYPARPVRPARLL